MIRVFLYLVLACFLSLNAAQAIRQISNVDIVVSPKDIIFSPTRNSQSFALTLSALPEALKNKSGKLRFKLIFNKKLFNSNLTKNNVIIPYANGSVSNSEIITLSLKNPSSILDFDSKQTSKISIKIPKRQRKRFKLRNFTHNVFLSPEDTRDISGQIIIPSSSNGTELESPDREPIEEGVAISLIEIDANGTELSTFMSTVTDVQGGFSFMQVPYNKNYIVKVSQEDDDIELRSLVPANFELSSGNFIVDPVSEFLITELSDNNSLRNIDNDELKNMDEILRFINMPFQDSIENTLQLFTEDLQSTVSNLILQTNSSDSTLVSFGTGGWVSTGEPEPSPDAIPDPLGTYYMSLFRSSFSIPAQESEQGFWPPTDTVDVSLYHSWLNSDFLPSVTVNFDVANDFSASSKMEFRDELTGGPDSQQEEGENVDNYAVLSGIIERRNLNQREEEAFAGVLDINGVISMSIPGEINYIEGGNSSPQTRLQAHKFNLLDGFDPTIRTVTQPTIVDLYPVGDNAYIGLLTSEEETIQPSSNISATSLEESRTLGFATLIEASEIKSSDLTNKNYGLIGFEQGYRDDGNSSIGSIFGELTYSAIVNNRLSYEVNLETNTFNRDSVNNTDTFTVNFENGSSSNFANILLSDGKMRFNYISNFSSTTVFEGYIKNDASFFTLVEAIDERDTNPNPNEDFREFRALDTSSRSVYYGVELSSNIGTGYRSKSYQLLAIEFEYTSDGRKRYYTRKPANNEMSFALSFSDSLNFDRASSTIYFEGNNSILDINQISELTTSTGSLSGAAESLTIAQNGKLEFTNGNSDCKGFIAADTEKIIFTCVNQNTNSISTYIALEK